VTVDAALTARVRAWIAADPDPTTRAELEALLAAGDEDGLRDRFAGPLEFGTAGLRGALGAGPNRMNRAVVRSAAAGLARHLLASDPDAARRGVVIGFDARHQSDVFAADSAAVFTGAGLAVVRLPGPGPTPVLAHAVRRLGCAAGVMVTASHNPPRDNGYKVYWGDGAQIRPPVDREISDAIAAVTAEGDVPLGPVPDLAGPESAAAYAEDAVRLVDAGGARDLALVYTPMHGVGGRTFLGLLDRAGFPAPHVVAEQFEPDPDFPTVAFPNPEEPGALDLAYALLRRHGADAVVANDPDADRLAVALPARALTGDEVGALLAEHLLSTARPSAAGDGRPTLVVSTVASGTLVERVAEHHGARSVRTLTGFKWIEHAALTRPDHRFVLGYEEALGYDVGGAVRDKDGLTAGLVMAELLAALKSEGRTALDLLDDLARRHGRHVTAPYTVRADLDVMARGMEHLRRRPPGRLAGRAVVGIVDLVDGSAPLDLPPSDVVILDLGDGWRVVVRPSGTEPKLKCYLQVVVPAERDGRAEMAALQAAVPSLIGV
jgi:phosphomannomutase